MDKTLEMSIRMAASYAIGGDVPIYLRPNEITALLNEIDSLREMLNMQSECTCNERTLEQGGDACKACQDMEKPKMNKELFWKISLINYFGDVGEGEVWDVEVTDEKENVLLFVESCESLANAFSRAVIFIDAPEHEE